MAVVAKAVQFFNAAGEVVATAERDVQLTRYYPNGKACDDDGYVSGSFTPHTDDRV